MKDEIFGQPTLVVPYGAGPGVPRTVVVSPPDVPAQLVAFYAASPYFATIADAFLEYDATDRYHYSVHLVTGAATLYHGAGFGIPGLGVYETTFEALDPGPESKELYLGGRTTPSGTSVVRVLNGVDLRFDTGGTAGGQSGDRGTLDYVVAIASTGNIVAEAVVATSNSFTLRAGRAAEVEFFALCRPTTAPSNGVFNLRKTNLAGAQLSTNRVVEMNQGDVSKNEKFLIRNNTAADVTGTLALTLTGSGAGTTLIAFNSNLSRWMRVKDCGEAVKYPNTTQF